MTFVETVGEREPVIPFRTESWAATDTGAVRKHNEDSYLVADGSRVWLVADGMGGLERGDWASSQVVEAIAAVPAVEGLEDLLEAIRSALTEGQRTHPRRIRACRQADGFDSGGSCRARQAFRRGMGGG